MIYNDLSHDDASVSPSVRVTVPLGLQTALTNPDVILPLTASPTFPPAVKFGFTVLIEKKCHRLLANFLPLHS